MNLQKLVVSSLVLLPLLIGCNTGENKNVDIPGFPPKTTTQEQVAVEDTEPISNFDFYPTSTTGVVIHRNTYAYSYNEDHELSEWVAYELDSEDTKYHKYERPFFEQDNKVATKSAHWRNYKKSGYDKGHLLPAGDRRRSFDAYKETFYTSNVAPQRHDFNSGIINRLEEKTRYWAGKYDGLYVITGCVLEKGLPTIGDEQVSVPNYFYKILMTKDQKKMIAFLLPHQESNQPLYTFVTSVSKLESMTGIDFFAALPDAKEQRMEQSKDYKDWSFN